MPALLIAMVEIPGNPGQFSWEIMVANSEVSYTFLGNSLLEQSGYVEQLSYLMRMGQAQLETGLDGALSVPPNPQGYADIVETLFDTTDSVMYEGDLFYTAAAGDSVLDGITAAGEALLACIGAF